MRSILSHMIMNLGGFFAWICLKLGPWPLTLPCVSVGVCSESSGYTWSLQLQYSTQSYSHSPLSLLPPQSSPYSPNRLTNYCHNITILLSILSNTSCLFLTMAFDLSNIKAILNTFTTFLPGHMSLAGFFNPYWGPINEHIPKPTDPVLNNFYLPFALSLIAQSSCEAEINCINEIAKLILQLKLLFYDLKLPITCPFPIRNDDQGLVQSSKGIITKTLWWLDLRESLVHENILLQCNIVYPTFVVLITLQISPLKNHRNYMLSHSPGSIHS